MKSKFLQIKDCGKNGDLKNIEGKIRALRAQGQQTWYCVLNGQDTARLLRAYGKP